MKITRSGNTLCVSGIKELATVAANSFRTELNPQVPSDVRQIDLDFSETEFVDCGGLGALVGLSKRVRSLGENVTIRLLNPPRPLQRLVSIMGLESQFPTETRAPLAFDTAEADSQSFVA